MDDSSNSLRRRRLDSTRVRSKKRSKEAFIDPVFTVLCIGAPNTGKHSFVKRFDEEILETQGLLTVSQNRTTPSKRTPSYEFYKSTNDMTESEECLDSFAPDDSPVERLKRIREKLKQTKPTSKTIKYKVNGEPVSIIFKFLTKLQNNEDVIQTAAGRLFFFDVNDTETLSALNCLISEYETIWAGKTIPALCVANKWDIDTPKVSPDSIRNITSIFNIPFYYTSATEGKQVKQTIDDLLDQIYNVKVHTVWKSMKYLIRSKLPHAILNRNIVKVREAIETGKLPATPSNIGWPAIHVACLEGNLDFVRTLIQYDPTCVNAKGNRQWTPLHCAARTGELLIVRFLLQSGADVLAFDINQKRASNTSYLNIREMLKHLEILRVEYEKQSVTSSNALLKKETPSNSTCLNLSLVGLKAFPLLGIQLETLEEIYLVSNAISCIPDYLRVLKNLRRLLLFGNTIEFIPEWISDLRQLVHLDLRCNIISALNSSIGDMKQLKELYIGHNRLTCLPVQLSELRDTLEVLDIQGNPLGTIPSSLLPKLGDFAPSSNTALFSYLNNISDGGEVEYNRVKVMLIGDGNVGKTTLLHCFQEETRAFSKRHCIAKKFLSHQETIATDGIDIREISVSTQEGKEITWDCWDYAGQEIYYTTHQFFLSRRSIYLICFNLLEKNFAKVDYWLNSIHTRARGSPIFLVGTHLDDKKVTSEYLEEYIETLCKIVKPERFKSVLGVPSVKGIYSVGSRKEIGIQVLIEGIQKEILRSKFIGEFYPASWIQLENTLSVLRGQKNRPVITYTEFTSIASGCQIEEESIQDVAKFLHQVGVICYFEHGSEALRQLVIVDPQFLADVMSSIITIRHRFGQDQETAGILQPNDLQHVWSHFPRDTHNTLMELLETFEIAFKVPSLGYIIIPSLLTEQQPQNLHTLWKVKMNSKNRGHVFGRYYKFEFLPLGFFPRLFIRNFHLPGFHILCKWRFGQLLSYKNVKALFRYNYSTYTLKLEVHNEYSVGNEAEYRDAVKVIRILLENIQTTIEGWYDTNVSITVPCSHCLLSGTYSNWEFSLQECMRNITRGGVANVLCRNVRRIRLDYLVPDLSFADLKKKMISFNDLTIGEMIGVGAFGTVMKGTWNNKLVAIKKLVVPEDSLQGEIIDSDEEMKNRFSEFQREVWIMSCLRHPCVCALIGVSMDPMAIIMEYLPNGDMYHLFDKIKSSPGETQKQIHSFSFKLLLAHDIALGVEHLHGYDPPIIHRDLRSPNIFIANVGFAPGKPRAKIGDFGLSRLVVPSLAGGEFNANWLAPEVMKGEQYNEKMDVYSFGIILWEILTLQKPFEEYDAIFAGKPRNMFKEAVIDGLRPSIKEGEFDEDFVALIRKCWCGEPSKRPSFVDVVKELEKLLCKNNVSYMSNRELTRANTASSLSDVLSVPLSDSHGKIDGEEKVVSFYMKLEPGHSHTVHALCAIQEGKFVVSIVLNEIHIWDTTIFKHIKVINSGKKRFYCLYNLGESFLVGCCDGSILLYDAIDFKKQYELKGHPNGVPVRAITSMESEGYSFRHGRISLQVVYSGDAKGNIVVWYMRLKRKPKMKQMMKVAEAIGSLTFYNGKLCVGTEQKILLFQADSLTVVHEWKGHSQLVTGLQQVGDEMWSISADSTVRVWEEQWSECLFTLQAHTSRILAIAHTPGLVWTGSFDKSIMVWDAEAKVSIQEITEEHTDTIRSMITVNNIVWAGSGELDGHIRLWKPKLEPFGDTEGGMILYHNKSR